MAYLAFLRPVRRVAFRDRVLGVGSVGDGGSGGDPQGNGQNPATLLGSILRLDVDDPPAAQVDGVTVMAYHPNPVTLVSRVAWEFANVPTEVRVGMDVDDYAGIPFNGTDGLMDVALGLELGEGQRVDVHRFNDLVVAGGCL